MQGISNPHSPCKAVATFIKISLDFSSPALWVFTATGLGLQARSGVPFGLEHFLLAAGVAKGFSGVVFFSTAFSFEDLAFPLALAFAFALAFAPALFPSSFSFCLVSLFCFLSASVRIFSWQVGF